MGYEKTIIAGNVCTDPEVKAVTKDGKTQNVCNFCVAVDQGKNRASKFFNVSAWDNLAKTCSQWLKKGREVLVEGSIGARGYIDKKTNPQDPVAKASLQLTAYAVTFLRGGAGAGNGGEGGEMPSGNNRAGKATKIPDYGMTNVTEEESEGLPWDL